MLSLAKKLLVKATTISPSATGPSAWPGAAPDFSATASAIDIALRGSFGSERKSSTVPQARESIHGAKLLHPSYPRMRRAYPLHSCEMSGRHGRKYYGSRLAVSSDR